jgi:cystathionine gamma-lyase
MSSLKSNGLQSASSSHHDATSMGFSTRAIHVGSEPSEDTGAVIPAISLSTTFKQHGVGGFKVSRGSYRLRCDP